MNVLIVYAHPEPLSLNGSIKNFAVERLQAAGHTVQVSDLYAMQWKPALDADDSLDGPATERFDAALDSSAPSTTDGNARTSPSNSKSCCGPIP